MKSHIDTGRRGVRAALFAACWALSFAAAAQDAGPDRDAGRGPSGGPPGAMHEGAWPGFGPGGPAPGLPPHGLHGLTLSEAQQDKLFAIMHAQAPQRREQDKAIRKAHQALRELERADRFDEAKAAGLARELGQAVAAEALLRARTEAQVLALLSPEQRQQLRARRDRAAWDGAPGRPGRP